MKKKKLVIVIAIIIVLAVLLIPKRINWDDGGSVSYKALVYEVKKINPVLPAVDGVQRYVDGLEIKILGMTVYSVVNQAN